jgi:hypothetical protein
MVRAHAHGGAACARSLRHRPSLDWQRDFMHGVPLARIDVSQNVS